MSETEKNKSDTDSKCESSADNDASPADAVVLGQGSDVCLALFVAFIFYEVGFHSLSNLPLENPLLFGIHARFWMQPHVLLCCACGVGAAAVLRVVDVAITKAFARVGNG